MKTAAVGIADQFLIFVRSRLLILIVCLFIVNAGTRATGEVFNVTDYGAAGDGVTDDTDAIRESIEAAGMWADANTPEVATIYFPAGEYAVAPRETDAGWNDIKPAIFQIPTSNLHFIGEGPDKSILSCYTLGLKHPETHWTVIGDGFGYFSIKRGSAFKMPQWETPKNNIKFEGLRITGNTDATGNAWVGGVSFRHGVIGGVVITYQGNSREDKIRPNPYENGTLLRFGSNANQPLNIASQAAYYVVNASEDGFQISDMPDGAPLILKDTVDSTNTRFISTNGDGWNMGHSAFDLGGQAFEGFIVDNCHLDRWRGEIMHAGGDNVKTIIIRNSIIEHSNASMVSVPSLVMEDSVIRYGYNGIENYARQPWHKAEIRRCRFVATADRQYGETNAIAYLGSPETGAVFEDNIFENWSRGILLSEVANNVSIQRNKFHDLNQLLTISRLGMYANDPWTGFDNITFAYNEAWATRKSYSTAVYTQFGRVSNKNYKIIYNTLHTSNEGHKYGLFIQEIANSSVTDRDGYVVSNNTFDGGTDFRDSVRPVYENNVTDRTWGQKRDIYSWDESSPVRIKFNCDLFTGRNWTEMMVIDFALDPAVYDKFPKEFKVELRSDTGRIQFLKDPAWNNFETDILIEKNNSIWIIVEENGKFGLLNKPVTDNPPTPKEVTLEISIDGVSATWTPVEGVEYYEIQVSPVELDFTEESNTYAILGNQSNFILPGLLEEASYKVRVRSITGEGVTSEWSEQEWITVPIAELIEPFHQWSFDITENGMYLDDGMYPTPIQSGEIVSTFGIGATARGIRFSGNHSGLQVPSTDTINTGEQSTYTVSFWLRPDFSSASNTSVIYEQGGYWRGLNLVLDRGYLQASGWNRPSGESDWQGTTLQGGRLMQSEWNHVALVLSGSREKRKDSFRLFLNGVLADTGIGSQLWVQNDSNGIGQVKGSTVYLGREVRSLHPLQAEMDDLTIWGAALTQEEIEQLVINSYDDWTDYSVHH